jgi:hypothetical protein
MKFIRIVLCAILCCSPLMANAIQIMFRGGLYTAYIGDQNADGIADVYLRSANKFVPINGVAILPLWLRGDLPSYLITTVRDASGVHYNPPTTITTETFDYKKMAEFSGTYTFVDKNADGKIDLQLEGSSQILYKFALNGNTQTAVNLVYELRPKIFDFSTLPDSIENWDMKRCTDPQKPTASPSCDAYRRSLIY